MNLDPVDRKRDVVVITGFGPFRGHRLNPSWEAIKGEEFKIDRANIEIIKKQISVSYKDVDQVVEDLWNTYKPILMVHIGLAAFETSIRIEQVARHGPFIYDDICDFAPHKSLRVYDVESCEENVKRHNYSCKPCDFEAIQSALNLDRICDKLNDLYTQGQVRLPCKKSSDAGLYVCEYIYQKSLRLCNKAVFIHIPNTDNFSLVDIRVALKYAIEALIDEVNAIPS